MRKVAFLTEMGFFGKIPATHPNMRTEFAWMHALDADHFHIYEYSNVKNYDVVMIIFPKGEVVLNAVAVPMKQIEDRRNFDLLNSPFMSILKKNNKKVYIIQEGPSWFFNEYEIEAQFGYYNMLNESDGVLVHNQSDLSFYMGLMEGTLNVDIIPTLLIEDSIKDILPNTLDQTIIGGNFCRWYGGFQSFIIARRFGLPIYAQTSHAMRENEDRIEGLTHLPRMIWIDWMRALSHFKYAVHMMPTVAAGTFYLNCAYFGIPCIGNKEVITQNQCFPKLSVSDYDVNHAIILAERLKEVNFYKECSEHSKEVYRKQFSIEVFREELDKFFDE